MRMVVVLPEPLGPRKPHTSPSRHRDIDMIDRDLAAEALGQPVHIDGEFVGASQRPHFHRLARD